MPVRSYKSAEDATQKSHTGKALLAPDPRGQALSIGIGRDQKSEFHKATSKMYLQHYNMQNLPCQAEIYTFALRK